MGKIYDNVSELVGRTPIVRLNRLTEGLGAQVVAKLEFYNPANSVKDRIGVAIIDAAEQSGELKPGGTIVEATSGNTGIALAMIGAARGYKVILTMPETMSTERRVMLRAFGAEIVLTPGAEGMAGAVARAKQIIAESDNAVCRQSVRQPRQPGDPREHHRRGGLGRHRRESRHLRRRHRHRRHYYRGRAQPQGPQARRDRSSASSPRTPRCSTAETPDPTRFRASAPTSSPRSSTGRSTTRSSTSTLDDSIRVARALGTEEGILGGISSGANVWAALELAKRPENAGKLIVTVVCDFGERYISTALFEHIRD